MKKLGFTILAFLMFLGGVSRIEAADVSNLDSIVKAIAASSSIRFIGLEMNPLDHAWVSYSPELQMAISKGNLAQTIQILSAHSNYEYQLGKDYLLIYPKDDPKKHDSPLCMRLLSYPGASGVQAGDYLHELKTDQLGATVYFGKPGIPDYDLKYGTIAMQSGKGACHEVLNNVAGQIDASLWIIRHGVKCIPGTYQPILPAHLNVGEVSFYHPPLTH